MLQYLKIANLALLDRAAVEFDGGFVVVTGETGAGKSALLGALSLLSGARGDKSLIRQGAESCEVEAVLQFERPEAVDAALERMDLPACDQGELLLKRSLRRSKPSRISINGSLATLANLQELGRLWIDFHGPGEPQRLLAREVQLRMIDLFAKLDGEGAAYEAAYEAWRETLGRIERLKSETQLSDDQIAYMQGQVEQIDALEISEEAIEQLETDFNRVAGSQELVESAGALAEGLTGEGGAADVLAPLSRLAEEAAQTDPSQRELAERVRSLVVEAQELGREYQRVGEAMSFEPETAAAIQERMAAWQELRRKHGRAPAEVLAAREALAERIALQGDLEGSLRQLRERADREEQALRSRAKELTRKRLAAGEKLAAAAEATLLQLGFKKGRLAVEMVRESRLRRHGDALPELMFSPNVGEPLQALAKIASSGELARVMLALKSVLARVDDIPVLVFDEVDANVGGEIGSVVGRKLREIAVGRQVFCVTHLPQVAALGDQHFLVEKDQSGDRALIRLARLERAGSDRVAELARMLGDRASKSALSHAKELLSA